MSRTRTGLATALSAVAAIAVAGVAEAGVVYVPIENKQPGDIVRIWVTNTGSETASFTTLFLPVGTDGTVREEGAGQVRHLPPGGTLMFGGGSAIGLLEIDADPALAIAARLVKNWEAVEEYAGSVVPVISSDNAEEGGGLQYVQQLQRSGDGRYQGNMRIVNLGHGPSTCTATAYAASGSALAEPFELDFQPLSIQHYDDYLAFLGEDSAAHTRVKVSCDSPFFAYGTVTDVQTGRSLFVGPSASGTSALRVPGAAQDCEGVCFEVPGVFHVPTPSDRLKRIGFEIDPGTYKRIRFSMEVRLSSWTSPSEGLHSIIWLALERNLFLYSYISARGPGQNNVMVRHGIGIPQHEKSKDIAGIALQPGNTYRFEYFYDTQQRSVVTWVYDEVGNLLLTIPCAPPNVNNIFVDPGEVFYADFGFTGVNPNEPPTYNWTYQNLWIEFMQ